MKKLSKRKTKKRVSKRNPTAVIKLNLTNDELANLEILRSKYDSPRILLDAYNNGTWDMNIVARAFIATKDDGGKLGTVPNISSGLKKKILELFGIIIDNKDELEINTRIDLDRVLK